jgi:hypothetical protein
MRTSHSVADLVDPELLVAELCGVLVELVELDVRQQVAGAGSDVGLELVAQPVDGVQVVEVEGGDHGASSRAVDDQALRLEAPQSLADGDEAHVQHPGDLAQGELLAGRQRAAEDRATELRGDQLGDRPRLDRSHRRARRRHGCTRSLSGASPIGVIHYSKPILARILTRAVAQGCGPRQCAAPLCIAFSDAAAASSWVDGPDQRPNRTASVRVSASRASATGSDAR